MAPGATPPSTSPERFWDARAGRSVDERSLVAALASADFVLLGETHDNPAHHRLEAALLRALAAAGRRPVVAFEMLDADQQALVDSALAEAREDADARADALARAVGWARSGWPDFTLYRPVFAAALQAGLPIVAADLSRRRAREVASLGVAAMPPRARALLERAGPLPEDQARLWREEMRAAHCGELPDAMLGPLVLMQRARDAQLAARLLATAGASGAVLVAGAEHVRVDRGVPTYLAREAAPRRAIALGMLEVPHGTPGRAGADARAGAFDYVAFTPAAAREDPCRELRRGARGRITPPPSGARPGPAEAAGTPASSRPR